MIAEYSFTASDGRIIVTKTRVCPVCGKTFRKPSSGKNPTCSMKCKYSNPVFKNRYIKNNNPQWKGGVQHKGGYLLIKKQDHPRATLSGYIFEHIIIAEGKIGRQLKRTEVVHHLNGIKTDNRLENIEILSRSEHVSHHMKEWWKRRRENAISNQC